ncbi:MAG: hypothetical protein MRY64_12275 [Hyphomonadaceae bacterium]|nr:hypothetical protein [Hyphomonadaceae bacterium]
MAGLIMVLALAGCSGLWAGQGGEVETMPAAMCPVVTQASAWTNRMPSTDDSGPVMRVLIRFDMPSSLRLYRDETTRAPHLALELRASDQPALPAIGYREPAREPARETISISCQGKLLVRIESIRDVY